MKLPSFNLRPLRSGLLALLSSLTLLMPSHSAASDKPIRLVVPFPAGSATDALARIVAQELAPRLKTSVIVDNRPGAGGVIGAEAVKGAPADGYTLLVTTNTTQAANKSLFKQLPYDPARDFSPVGKIGTSGMVLMVRPDFPAQTLKEFVTQVKTAQKGLTYGHGSAASQVSAALLLRRIQVPATAVAYKGVPNAVADLIGGHIDFVFVDLSNALSHIQSGKLKAIAVTMEKRAARAPSVPTIGEDPAFEGFAVNGWFALMAPANTPSQALDPLTVALKNTLGKEDVRERMAAIGIAPDFQPPPALAELIDREVTRWGGWVEAAGIKPE